MRIPNKKGDKTFYYYDLGGRAGGNRISTGIFIYNSPKDNLQRNHNTEAVKLLAVKKSEAILDQQSIGTPFIPKHKFKENFLDFYKDYVKKHRSTDNRHLPCSLVKFKEFIGKDYISPTEITEDFCKQFRKFLLSHLNGETPQNYFAGFKWVINAATKARYFLDNPAEDVSAKANPSKELKEIIEVEDFLAFLATPCRNEEVSQAFIFCLYTGLRWADISVMKWLDIKENIVTTRLIQVKTGKPVVLTLHPTALKILEKQRAKKQISGDSSETLVFDLPTADGSNKVLKTWANEAGIKKSITWSCARLSFSILLQDKRVDLATVAYMLGHATTKQVLKTYKRHRPKNQMEVISLLPGL